MPSTRKQLNVRLSDQGWEHFVYLSEEMPQRLGIEVSQADVIHAALAELAKHYADEGKAKAPKRGRK